MVSRRQFMKGLGLTGTALGITSLTAPTFHDLDEALTTTSASLHRPWYVKEREYGDIGIELDWKLLKPRLSTIGPSWLSSAKEAAVPSFKQADFDKALEAKTKEIWPNYTGPTTRDYAFANACSSVGLGGSLAGPVNYAANTKQGGFKVPPAPTPEQLGLPKWQGTPEENNLMVRAALSYIGIGPAIGASELDEKTKNFFFVNHKPDWVWDETISQTYTSTDGKTQYLPTSNKYVVVSNNMGATELGRRSPSVLAGSRILGANIETVSYSRVAFAKNFFEEFIRGIGYHCFYNHSLSMASPWAMWSGVGEHARMGQLFVSPQYGANLRTNFVVFTDLPQAFTHPTDGGVTKFCETCGICAENCPVGAISMRSVQRSWDNMCGQNWSNDVQAGGTQTMWNIPGYKGWRVDMRMCQGCCSCKFSCPFNTTRDGNFLHSVVKATASTTPIFNSFFRQMETAFHYGKQDKDPESWWDDPAAWSIYGADYRILQP